MHSRVLQMLLARPTKLHFTLRVKSAGQQLVNINGTKVSSGLEADGGVLFVFCLCGLIHHTYDAVQSWYCCWVLAVQSSFKNVRFVWRTFFTSALLHLRFTPRQCLMCYDKSAVVLIHEALSKLLSHKLSTLGFIVGSFCLQWCLWTTSFKTKLMCMVNGKCGDHASWLQVWALPGQSVSSQLCLYKARSDHPYPALLSSVKASERK